MLLCRRGLIILLEHIAIPKLFGIFSHFLETNNSKPLYAEQSSRMNHDGNDYTCFKIMLDGSKALKDEEQEAVQKKI